MTLLESAVVTFGADIGGKDANSVMSEHIFALRILLAEECRGPYSDVIKKIDLVLRVDGNVQSWGRMGVDKVRVQKKSFYATADIFVPQEKWQKVSAHKIRVYLGDEVGEAVRLIAQRASQENLIFYEDQLMQDVQRVVKRYLEQTSV